MTALRQLKLPFNRLKTLPIEVGQLEELAELTLQHNQLVKVPVELGYLSKLDALIVDHNEVSMCMLRNSESRSRNSDSQSRLLVGLIIDMLHC